MAPPVGLEPTAPRLTAACSTIELRRHRQRVQQTNQTLCVGVDLSFQSVARQVFSALVSLTAVFGMGTGGPSPLKTPTIWNYQILLYSIPFVKGFFQEAEAISLLKYGTPSGTRTLDTLIKSQVLYQLS